MTCKAVTSDGARCQAHAMRDGGYCFRHNSKVKDQAYRASSDGGQAKRQYHRLGSKIKIETPADIKRLMAKALNRLWTGDMPASNPAGALGYLAKTFLDAHEKSELELRLENVEKRVDQMQQ